MKISKFNDFIKENKLIGKDNYEPKTDDNLWKDEDESQENINNKYIISLDNIKQSNVTLQSLKTIFKKYSDEDLISEDCFHFVGELKGDNEKLYVINTTKDYDEYSKGNGVVYLITLLINDKEYLLKIGQARTNWKLRLNSYNCGKEEYRKNGTNSVTNYKVLQTICYLSKNHPDGIIKLYLYYPKGKEEEIIWKGINSGISIAGDITVAVEYILVSLCNINRLIPVMNTQISIKGAKKISKV